MIPAKSSQVKSRQVATVCEEDTEFVLLPKLDADEPRRPLCLFVTNEIDPPPSSKTRRPAGCQGCPWAKTTPCRSLPRVVALRLRRRPPRRWRTPPLRSSLVLAMRCPGRRPRQRPWGRWTRPVLQATSDGTGRRPRQRPWGRWTRVEGAGQRPRQRPCGRWTRAYPLAL